MSKIGAQQGEFAAARSKGGSDLLSIGSKARFESSLKRQTSNDGDDAGSTANKSIGLGKTPQSAASTPPPTYETAGSIEFSDIAPIMENGASSDVETFKALSTGISSDGLPNIVIVGSVNDIGNVAIATVGANILIPSAIFAQWQDTGTPDAHSADQFNQAFSNFLSRSSHSRN